MDGVDHAARAVGLPEGSLRGAPRTVPQQQVAALLLGEPAHDVPLQVDADGAAELQRFVVGERRRPERVPGEHEERAGRIEVGIRADVRQLFEPPPFDFAPRGVEGVFRGGGVGVDILFERGLPASAACRLRRTRRSAHERPLARELLQRRAEAGQVKIDAAHTRLLEIVHPLPHGPRNRRLHVFPIAGGAVAGVRGAGAADQKYRAVGRRLVPDVHAALGLGVDRPGRGDDEPRFDQPARQRVPGAGRLVGEHERHDAVRFERPAALGEDQRHPLLVVAMREGAGAALAGEPGRIGDRFVLLVGQPAAEQFREHVAGGALEPDVEEVGQLRVHHVVVVRRIHDDGVHRAVVHVVQVVARLAGDSDGRRLQPRPVARLSDIKETAGACRAL